MKSKFIAIYYPQFHTIRENDEAWGNGFTDWNRVKEAMPLFEGHYQPRIPLHSNYYDLTNPHELERQVKIAKEYGVYGFCFYHYWFDGKLLLEKPLDIFLNTPGLDMPFCLSWANETWTKRWTGEANVIIQEQTHKPDRTIWKKHFEYLLPFFKDERYIRIDNKPVFLFYQSGIINHLQELLSYWQHLAIESGLDGIHFIDTKRQKYVSNTIKRNFDGILKYQPQEAYNSNNFGERSFISRAMTNISFFVPERVRNIFSKYKDKAKNGINRFDSNKVWASIISNAYKKIPDFNGTVYESIFVNWDNSPRYNNRANVYSMVEPDDFDKYLSEMISKTKGNNAEYIFINAWNEWAEGAYLEPDEKYKYRYLEVIQRFHTKNHEE